MDYIRLGNTGMKVSRICLGMMTYGRITERWPRALNEEESRPFIQKALELGINFFDTADIYSFGTSEEVLGNAIRDFARRDEVVIATKVFIPMSKDPNDGGLSRKHIMSSIDASLKRLKTDYVDLYQKDSDFDIVTRLSEIAAQRGLPDSQIALAWMLSKPAITSPIIGASKPGHLEDAVASLSVKLTSDEITSLEELYEPHQVLGHS